MGWELIEESNIFWKEQNGSVDLTAKDENEWKQKLVALNRGDQDFLLSLPDKQQMELQLAKLAIQLQIPERFRNRVIQSILEDIYDYSILSDLMKRPKVTTVWIFGDRAVQYAESGKIKRFEKHFFDLEDLYLFIEKKLSNTTFRYARNIPEIDTILPDGSRFHIMQGSSGISEINSQGFALTRRMPIITIRLFSYPYKLEELIKDRTLLTYMSYLPQLNQSFVISGNQGSGKTTHLNAMIAHTPKHQHVIIIEEAPEMQPLFNGICVRLWNQGLLDDFHYVNMIKNTKATLRMTGDVMVIGEIRDEETTWEFLRISNVGLSLVACSLHANSAKDAIFRLFTLGIASSNHPPERTVTDMIARGITHIIHLRREGEKLGIEEVLEITGIDHGEIVSRVVFQRDDSTGNMIYYGLSDVMMEKILKRKLPIEGLMKS